jgi:hypothetical protein
MVKDHGKNRPRLRGQALRLVEQNPGGGQVTLLDENGCLVGQRPCRDALIVATPAGCDRCIVIAQGAVHIARLLIDIGQAVEAAGHAGPVVCQAILLVGGNNMIHGLAQASLAIPMNALP